MPFTVWCNDRLVGESDLDYIANTDDHKMGDFLATPFGDELIPTLMAPRVALLARAARAEVKRAQARRDRIVLELRDPGGAVIPAEHIEITDTSWLLEIADGMGCEDDQFERIEADPPPWLDEENDDLDEFDVPDVEFGAEEPPADFPRYQLQVRFERNPAKARG